MGSGRGKERGRTESDAVVALELFEEAVELAHLAHCGLCVPLGGCGCLDLFAKRLDVLGRSGEVIEDVRHALSNVVSSELGRGAKVSRTYGG